MKFTYVQAPPLMQTGQLAVDGASKDCVDWFLQTVYQPHYDHFKADFGKTIRGFFFDEPETPGDWGTELNATLAEWKVDWKKAYVAYKFELAGEEQIAAKYQYMDALGRDLGPHDVRRHDRLVPRARREVDRPFHGTRHAVRSPRPLRRRHDAIAEIQQHGRRSTPCLRSSPSASESPTTPRPGRRPSSPVRFRTSSASRTTWRWSKSSARGQDLTYSEMKWWADHMQVSGVNFLIPHSFNPRSPYDTDCPPYFYNGGFEPRWPLYRVFADYTSRLSLMLTGGRHVCPVAILFGGNSFASARPSRRRTLTSALQDAQFDCDWLPFEVFESHASLGEKAVKLHGERYRVLVVPPVEVIPYGTLAKAKEFFDAGGVVVGYGFLPSKSATIGKTGADIAALCREIWGDDAKPGLDRVQNQRGRRPVVSALPDADARGGHEALADAGVHPSLEVLEGKTDGWLHVLHRVKDDRDVMFVANQNHLGAARTFKFRATAAGEPELWDPMRNEITAIPFQRIGDRQVEFSLSLEPLETALLVFQPTKIARPMRIEAGTKPIHEPIVDRARPEPAGETAGAGAEGATRDA